MSTTLTVSLHDLGRVGEVIDAAVRAGGSYRGMALRLRDEAAERRAALEEAVRDARARAEALAQATGRELGELVGVAEEDGGARAEGGGQRAEGRGARGEGTGSRGAMVAQPGALVFAARVRARYELR